MLIHIQEAHFGCSIFFFFFSNFFWSLSMLLFYTKSCVLPRVDFSSWLDKKNVIKTTGKIMSSLGGGVLKGPVVRLLLGCLLLL